MVEKINLLNKVNSTNELFQYLKVGKLNNHSLNVLQAENRTLDFHTHTQSDELFYVIEGSLELELDYRIITLVQGDMIIIPKGVRHRPVVKELVKCLLVELEGTLNEGNTGGAYG